MLHKLYTKLTERKLLLSVPILLLAVALAPLLVQNASGLTVSDNFNRADGGLGANWTTVAGTAAPTIANQVLQPGTANTLNSAYWSANTFGSDQYVQATMPASSGNNFGPGIAVRLSSSKGYFLWYGNSSNEVSIWRMDSVSGWTELTQSSALTVNAATDVWKLQAVGSTISAYQNGTRVAQATDPNITTGAPGVWMYYGNNRISNWSGGDVTSAPTYSVGGSVSGLLGTVVLQNNGGDDLSISANSSYTFAIALASGSPYNVTVKTNPNGQTCTVTNGSGTIATTAITNVAVACTTNATPTYSVGGTVTGISGTVVLQNNGGGNLNLSSNGSFTFAAQLASGSAYAVSVSSNPSGQTCVVSNGSGVVASSNITNVAVSCTTNTSGTASDDFNRANGPLGSGWTDMTDGGLAVTSNAVAGATTGNTGDVRTGETYNSDQYSEVQVTATQLTGSQWIGPMVRSQNGGQNGYLGLYWWNGGNPVLMVFKRVSGGWTQLGSYSSGALPAGTTLEMTASGSTITFLENGVARITATDSSLTDGAPGIMSYGTGRVDNWSGGSMVSGPSYTVGGTVSGLTGAVTLLNNGTDSLSVSANGNFTFHNAVPAGSSYNVTVQTEPAGQACSVTNGSGTVGSGNVTNVNVICQTDQNASGTDDFNRGNGPLGPNWTDNSDGGLAITSGAVAGKNAATTTGDAYTGTTYPSDQYSQVEVTANQLTGGQWIGPSVRMQNGGQKGYAGIYWWNGGSPKLMLFRRDAGNVWVQLGVTTDAPLTAGTQLRIVAVGDTIALLENGVERLAAYDATYTGGAPGIMSYGTGQVDNWSGGAAGFQVDYLSTDSNGVRTYDMLSGNNGHGPQTLRVLQPTNPAPGVKHNFLIVLPVEAGQGTSFGDGIQTMLSANVQNQYNLTIVEPSFAIEPWYANNPTNTDEQQETFMTQELFPWVKTNLATSGTEQSWLIGFSKSGIGGQDLILKHPDIFTLAASWDFPADMSAYNQYDPSSTASYGTDANFQASYRLSPSFLAAHKAPFTTANRIWIGGYASFTQDDSDYDALLTAQGIQHTTETPTFMTHRWDSGWVPVALAALYQDSLSLGS